MDTKARGCKNEKFNLKPQDHAENINHVRIMGGREGKSEKRQRDPTCLGLK
jgi:hypothetical protein